MHHRSADGPFGLFLAIVAAGVTLILSTGAHL